jgi:hypothetical protein
MIFNSELLLSAIILIVGMAFFTSSMVEHVDGYKDALSTDIVYGKANYQLKSLIGDGTIEACILLMNNGDDNIAKTIIKNRIPYDNYQLKIGNYTINGSPILDTNKTYIVASAVIMMNRTEGWYGVYGDNTEIHLMDDKYFLSYEDALDYMNTTAPYNTYDYKKPVYYFKSSEPITVKFILYND